MNNLNKLKEQYDKLGEEIKALETKPKFKEVTLLVPTYSKLFEDLEVTHLCAWLSTWSTQAYREVKFKLYEPTKEQYTFYQATSEFNNVDTGRLMSKEEIHHLISLGYIKQDDDSFWSSSVVSYNRNNAWLFYGSNGNFINYNRNNNYAARCLGRP